MSKAIGYVRVSAVGERGGDSFITTDLQESENERVGVGAGVEIIETITELNESGGRYERPGIQRAIEAIERGEASAIVAAKLDRIARSVVDLHRIIERVERAGGRLIVGDLGIDTSTPNGRMIVSIVATFAEWELNRSKASWEAAKASAFDRGVRIGKAPIGYRLADDRTLELDPKIAPLVLEIFRSRAVGNSLRSCAAMLERALGRPIYPQTITSMIQNRVYRGELVYGEHERSEPKLAIVSEVEWQAAQSKANPRPNAAARSLLAGIVRCASCGAGMTSTTNGRGLRSYRCPGLSKYGRCAARSAIVADELDKLIEDELLETVERELAGAPLESIDVDLEPLERELAEARLDLARFHKATIGLDVAAIRAGTEARLEEIAALEQELELARQAAGETKITTSMVELWRAGELPLDERRTLIAAVLEGVTVRRAARGTAVADRIEIVWRP
jgi:site-specific DNA recombinase